jgi:mycofactocin precursor
MDSPIAPSSDLVAPADVAASTNPVTSTNAAPVMADSTVIDSDLLVEEISIDGMCGVY